MTTDHDRPSAGHNEHHERATQGQPGGAESPRQLLALHDPSRRRGAATRPPGRGHGTNVEWVRPTDLAARIGARAAAAAVAAHVAGHRRVRGSLRARVDREDRGRAGRLAPLSAFGRKPDAERTVAARSVIGR